MSVLRRDADRYRGWRRFALLAFPIAGTIGAFLFFAVAIGGERLSDAIAGPEVWLNAAGTLVGLSVIVWLMTQHTGPSESARVGRRSRARRVLAKLAEWLP